MDVRHLVRSMVLVQHKHCNDVALKWTSGVHMSHEHDLYCGGSET